MSNSKFLARVVTAALLSGAAFNASAWSYCSDTGCEVIGYPPDYCEDFWECNGYPDDPYDPPSDHGGDNDSGGGGDPYNAAECLNLMQIGLPSGCTPELAAAGPPQDLFMTYWGLDGLMNSNIFFRSDVHQATLQLQQCYGNYSFPPSTCETNFMSGIDAAYSYRYPSPSTTQNDVYFLSWAMLYYEMIQAANQRDLSDLVNWLSGSTSYGGISINIGGLLSLPMQLNGFNRMWIKASQQKVCQLWMDAYQQNGCGG